MSKLVPVSAAAQWRPGGRPGWTPVAAPDGSASPAAHAFYLVALACAILQLPPVVLDPVSTQFLLIIGVIGVWRYSWAAVHFVRSLIYRHWVFPRWRRSADLIAESTKPSHLYLVVTSFRISTRTSVQVYRSVFEEAVRYGAPTTIVASIVEMADQRLVKAVFRSCNPPEHVRLKLVRVPGSGKRVGLACAFRAISRDHPAPGFIAAVIDGDSLLAPGLLGKCIPFFWLRPRLGALTTDEVCAVEGSRIFRHWYDMRFAQRHIAMASHALSGRVLTLTGRMSLFRGELLVDPSFIERVEIDWIDHWRLGRFRFLTGDDKSTWYWMLQNGFKMLYVPDVRVTTVETPPHPRFTTASLMLMRRWFGNMLRTNGRAIALGPRRVGAFTWWCIVDQRISMWTTLVGPAGAILATFIVTPFALLYYLCWIGITRYVLTLSLLSARPQVSAWYPFLLYYNQIVGSLVKTRLLTQLDRQKWTRQMTTLSRDWTRAKERRIRRISNLLHILSFTILFVLVAFLIHILDWPRVDFWRHKLGF